jgi:hypothetical protein
MKYLIKAVMTDGQGEDVSLFIGPNARIAENVAAWTTKENGRRFTSEFVARETMKRWAEARPALSLVLETEGEPSGPLSAEEARILGFTRPETTSYAFRTYAERLIADRLVTRGFVKLDGEGCYVITSAGRNELEHRKHVEDVAPVRAAFQMTRSVIQALPRSRMRTLALIDLETCFARACFAATEMQDPIGG